jgi:hypothetical protein
MISRALLEAEVDANYEAFLSLEDGFSPERDGQYALMRMRTIEGFFPSAREAIDYGEQAFSDGRFSVQQVKADIIDLGFFSHAIDTRIA